MKLDLAPQAGRVTRADCTLADGRVLAWHVASVDPARVAEAGIAPPPSIVRAVPKRQAEFLHGRLCARAALAELGLADAQVGVADDRAPLWPAGFTGSITHASALAAAVALPAHACRGIGIDVEDRAHGAHAADLAGVALNERELARLPGHLDRAIAMLLVFSAKESFYKAVAARAGRFFGFEALELEEVTGDTLHFHVAEALTPEWRIGAACRIDYAVGATHLATAFVW